MTQTSLLTQSVRGFSEDVVRELSRLKEEPDWLLERRLAAWQSYQATPMPTLSDEDWRRTDISDIPFAELLPYRPATEIPGEIAAPASSEASAGHLIQHDSDAVSSSLNDAARESGLLFCSLDEAVRQHPELIRAYLLGEAFPPSRGKFAALNAAMFSGGTFLYVPKGVEISLPLQSTTWLSSPSLALFPHTLVVVEPGAQVTLIEEFQSSSLDAPSLLCPGVEVYLQPSARLHYVAIQQMSTDVYVLGTHRTHLGNDSRLDYLAVGLGGRLTKQYIDVLLQGDGSTARLLGVVLGDGDQHFDYQTLQEHSGANGTSDLLFKVAVKDQAMSVHYGMVHVRKSGRGTNAGQTVRNLILSDGAKAHPILPLEIEASDIRRCAHAAAIGQIDENQMFYLQSRGLSRRQAEKLVVDGFFEGVMAKIPLPRVQEQLRASIDSKLPAD
ncbi:MAG: Fe-S cluster assembly protein SufD [Dehalococcoidia bacterium]